MISDKKTRKLFAIGVISIVLLCLTLVVPAQRVDQTPMPSVASSASTARTMPQVRTPLPFGEGEVMKFEVKFSRFPIFASVGEMTFRITEEKGKPEKSPKAASEKTVVEKTETSQPGKTDESSRKIKPEEVDRVRIH